MRTKDAVITAAVLRAFTPAAVLRALMALLLISFCGDIFASESAENRSGKEGLDRVVTVVGRDETVLPVPWPRQAEEIQIPALDPWKPPTPGLPPVQPPGGLEAGPVTDPPPLEQLGGSGYAEGSPGIPRQ